MNLANFPPSRWPFSPFPDARFPLCPWASHLSFEEAFGEKVRALAERVRPRDLYDVVNLYRHAELRPEAGAVAEVVRRKCAFKGVPFPRAGALEPSRASLAASWQGMLGHQLPQLPSFEPFWDQLGEVLRWLETGEAPAPPAALPVGAGEEVLRPDFGRLGPAAGGRPLEAVRFAAGNRLCVDLRYQGSVRRIEPYSLRRTREGDVLLYALRRDTGEVRAYRVDRIEGVQVTQETFSPRYAVELSPSWPLRTPPVPSPGGLSLPRLGTPRLSAPPKGRRAAGGPTHVFECMACGKKFRKKTFSALLNPHKDKDGRPCYGRVGRHVETKWG